MQVSQIAISGEFNFLLNVGNSGHRCYATNKVVFDSSVHHDCCECHHYGIIPYHLSILGEKIGPPPPDCGVLPRRYFACTPWADSDESLVTGFGLKPLKKGTFSKGFQHVVSFENTNFHPQVPVHTHSSINCYFFAKILECVILTLVWASLCWNHGFYKYWF